MYVWTYPLTVEFDIIDTTGNNALFQCYDGTNNCIYYVRDGHWKVSIDSDGVLTVTVDGETISQVNGATKTLSASFRTGFRPQTSSFKFKDWIMYYI